MIADLTVKEPGFPVWPQNMSIVIAFLAVSTQWHLLSLGTGGVYWQGLDYARVAAGLDKAGIALSPEQWSGLRLMERTAASALNGYRG
ncbi:DUF1799 domain-containing protein [Sphingobium sp. SA2]|uniref:DUF1799 domain-containing protein n=1 Tax=Sphingobium sp. SA2 TaxID=1524832 RepID=UPI0028C308AC|nr:DUF1799 domain-containing protein [Sphingobium sp. SA2]MDT7533729.1 DUF1799 domain-containing protein [Sphingobium sp. SA2]